MAKQNDPTTTNGVKKPRKLRGPQSAAQLELTAMKVCAKHLSKLTPTARARVIAWANDAANEAPATQQSASGAPLEASENATGPSWLKG